MNATEFAYYPAYNAMCTAKLPIIAAKMDELEKLLDIRDRLICTYDDMRKECRNRE